MPRTSFVFKSVAAALAALAIAAPTTAAEPAVEPVMVRAITYFAFDQDTLTPDEQAKVMAEVASMKGVTWQSVTAIGHTDSIGSPEYNAQLSRRRAEAVKGYLLDRGLSTDSIRLTAKAATAPVAPNDTEEGRARNRRTEIEFRGVRSTTR